MTRPPVILRWGVWDRQATRLFQSVYRSQVLQRFVSRCRGTTYKQTEGYLNQKIILNYHDVVSNDVRLRCVGHVYQPVGVHRIRCAGSDSCPWLMLAALVSTNVCLRTAAGIAVLPCFVTILKSKKIVWPLQDGEEEQPHKTTTVDVSVVSSS